MKKYMEKNDLSKKGEMNPQIKLAQLQVRSGHATLTPNAEAASRAFLAYYMANRGELDPAKVVEYATEFALQTGLTDIPPLESKLVSRLGLEGLVQTE